MCIFCDIVGNKIPSYKIYEDDYFIAILDISCATKGHTIVIPKIHTNSILELNDEMCSNYLIVVKKVCNLLEKSFNEIKGFNILSNINKQAGQSVMHAHIHVIPRYIDDNFSINFNQNSFDLNSLYQQIVSNK